MSGRCRSLLIAGLVALGLLFPLGGVTAPDRAVAGQAGVPGLIPVTDTQPWPQRPSLQPQGRITAVIHLQRPPLALVSRDWDQPRRQAYLALLRADQDTLIPEVTALGGAVVGRMAHASNGLAVELDASRLEQVRALGGVTAAHTVADYRLSAGEAAAWIGARAAVAQGLSGRGVNVAVIDTGVDYTHAKLGGPGTPAAYAAAYCGDPTATPDPADPTCTAHSQADATGAFPNAKVRGGFDWVGEQWPDGPLSSDPNPIDRQGHGTHVADIAAGLPSGPTAGDAGVAPEANLWAYKACSATAGVCNGLSLLLAIDDAMDLDDSDYGACLVGVDPDCRNYDPADIINLSIGAPYGQPEDDISLFVNIAGYYGSLVVASAGNSGDIPYSVASPSTADAALSVAESALPGERLYPITVGAGRADGLLMAWSAPIDAPLSGTLVYGDGAGGNSTGCEPFAPGGLAGKVVLLDRGGCAVSLKAANAAAAGALVVVVANNRFSNTPPGFGYGGGTVDIPVLTVTQSGAEALRRALGQTAVVTPEGAFGLADDLVSSSSRGPRIADGAIKPDIAAPGAVVSAQAGSGSGQSSFGGTSGAAPVVAGAAALVIERLQQRGLLDREPGLAQGSVVSLAPLLKALLMNTAAPTTTIGGQFLAPITLQGAGRIDALSAVNAGTVAWDITELYDALTDPAGATPCAIDRSEYPTDRIIRFVVEGIPPECAQYPYGNRLFNAWNGQTGSLSFGYRAVAEPTSLTRRVAVLNIGSTPRSYRLGSDFRYQNDRDAGVSVAVSPAQLDLAPGGAALVEVRLTIDPARLRDWTLSAGSDGASGTNIFCDNPNPTNGCPTLTLFEIDGLLTIDGGPDNTAHLPWQVLPRRVARTVVTGVDEDQIELSNPAASKSGDVDVFALIDISPNQCDLYDPEGRCVTEDYEPGIAPGINSSPIDLKEIGLRSRVERGLNAELGFKQPGAGAIPDEVVEFAITVYDAPYRSAHNAPIEFDVTIDSDSDGTDDYIVFTSDFGRDGSDGRSAVFVADVNPADGTRPTRPYFFSQTDINSQNWILPVPAAAVGLRSDRQFLFRVFAFDTYFSDRLWDCAPRNCFDRYRHTTGLPKQRAITTALNVPALGEAFLRFRYPKHGPEHSPDQQGLLLLYRDAEVGHGSESVPLP
ncbi:MAG TPA: S8 family serine peptidase [Roseiflexaceae bacterium]|nr:S8 family serine peptidase [Roseiflexaceae bacterium]